VIVTKKVLWNLYYQITPTHVVCDWQHIVMPCGQKTDNRHSFWIWNNGYRTYNWAGFKHWHMPKIYSEDQLRRKFITKKYLYFPIVSFQLICMTNARSDCTWSKLTRYFRACDSCQDLSKRVLLLTRKLLNQGLTDTDHICHR